MKHMTYFRAVIAVLTLGVLMMLLWIVLRAPEDAVAVVKSTPVQTFIPSFITNVPVPASGMVVAQDSVTVRSQTSGLVGRVFVTEGALVFPLQNLIAIDAPVVQQSVVVAKAQGALQELQQQAQEELATVAKQKAEVGYDSVVSLQILSESAIGKRVQEANAQLLVQLENTAVSLSSVLDFLDEHRTFLTSRASALYLEVVTALYDTQPSQLSSGIVYRVDDYQDLLATLRLLQSQKSVDVEAVENLTQLLDIQLQKVQGLLTDIESTFYDEKNIATTDSLYIQYQTHRATLIATQSALRSAQATLQKQLDALAESSVGTQTATDLAEVDQASASRQALYAEDITRQSSAVTQAQLDVLYAQYGLARAQAPFAGWIQKVYVDRGDFVQPGAPLFELVGSSAQEVQVQVASSDLQNLEVGQSFVVDGKTVGYVDRFTHTLSKGSAQVFIELIDEQFVLGEVISGVISMQSTDEYIARVPRSYIMFTTQGPRLLLTSNIELEVVIVADYGEELVVETKDVIDAPLMRPR